MQQHSIFDIKALIKKYIRVLFLKLALILHIIGALSVNANAHVSTFNTENVNTEWTIEKVRELDKEVQDLMPVAEDKALIEVNELIPAPTFRHSNGQVLRGVILENEAGKLYQGLCFRDKFNLEGFSLPTVYFNGKEHVLAHELAHAYGADEQKAIEIERKFK